MTHRIVSQLLLLAGLTTLITMAVGLFAYHASAVWLLHDATRRMPPEAWAEIQALVNGRQGDSERFFDLYARYNPERQALNNFRFVAIIALISASAGGAAAVWLARRISRPITAVARAAAQVSAGDRSVRVDKGSSTGEVGVLIDSFNQMAAQIDVYERERTVLTAGIAHELRTPLTILTGRLHALADGVIDPAAGEADRLLRQVEHLSRLVEDLHTLSLADAGALRLDQRKVHVDDVLRQVVADLRDVADQARITLEANYVAAEMLGDPLRLTQIFTNLLTNAIKHGPAGSTVTIYLVVKDRQVIVTVIDEGDGFPPEEQEKLFIPFWRGGADRRLGRPGSGMGLTLAAKLAEAHGGRIVARNRSDRSGARFSAYLPLPNDDA